MKIKFTDAVLFSSSVRQVSNLLLFSQIRQPHPPLKSRLTFTNPQKSRTLVRSEGAVPATIPILDGNIHAGKILVPLSGLLGGGGGWVIS